MPETPQPPTPKAAPPKVFSSPMPKKTDEEQKEEQARIASEAAEQRKGIHAELEAARAKPPSAVELLETRLEQAKKAAKVPVEKFCRVCGMGSHREDWQDVPDDQVECADHTDEEKAAAEKVRQARAKEQESSTATAEPSKPTAA